MDENYRIDEWKFGVAKSDKKRLRSFYCVPKLKLKKFTSKIFLVTLLLSLNEKQLFLFKKKSSSKNLVSKKLLC